MRKRKHALVSQEVEVQDESPAETMLTKLLGRLQSKETIQKRIEKRYNEMTNVKDGEVVPLVCTFCDEFILSFTDVNIVRQDEWDKIKSNYEWDKLDIHERSFDLEQEYRFDKSGRYDLYALSPRGSLLNKSNRASLGKGFTCCPKCKNAAKKNYTSFYSIINKNAVGCPPPELSDLTDVELAFLTPVRSHGYCFQWSGGKENQLRGTLTFMRIQERSIRKMKGTLNFTAVNQSSVARSVAQLDAMGLAKNVVILCSGFMTKDQKKRVIEKTTVRTEKLLAAVKWLCKNHRLWKQIDFEGVRQKLEGVTPIMVDRTKEVESVDSNVEKEELFSCYYPEGSNSASTGGFDNPESFREFVEHMHDNNYDVEVQTNLEETFTCIKGGDDLVNSSLLQFPYGIGGMNEEREKFDGSMTEYVELDSYLSHLSKISQPIFQKPLFQLILFSMMSKREILKSARFQLKEDATATQLANGLNANDVNAAINARRQGQYGAGTNVSRKLLDACDASARALPHTNEAAKKARSTGEAMQHHFGLAHIFLTVTFDDENSFILQVMAQHEIDREIDVSMLTDKEVFEMVAERRKLRINYPGLSAINFEILELILIEEVVGWDMRKDKPMDKIGYFGKPYAMTKAIEEQGRDTPHTHLTTYIEGYAELQEKAFFAPLARDRRDAKSALTAYMDKITSTLAMIGKPQTLKKSFDHECTVNPRTTRDLPEVVEEQELRHLRHKHGYAANEGIFAKCRHCDKTWTYEQLLGSYVNSESSFCKRTQPEDADVALDVIPKERIMANLLQFQRNKGKQKVPEAEINAVYNHHKSCHTRSCFRCAKKNTKHTCGPKCECRYRFPDMKRKNTKMELTDDVSWFSWEGVDRKRPLATFMPQRNTYDLFQNVSCTAISESKFCCNCNVSLITDGPLGIYQFKYHIKQTKDDDTLEYQHVSQTIKSLNGRKHDCDRSEALRLICRASFAHNKSHVIGPALASYLVRNKTRFYFSHDFTYCPLKDLIKIQRNECISGQLKKHGNLSFFENVALHYLCRPQQLENVSVRDFFENYHVVPMGKETSEEDGVLRLLHEVENIRHPAAGKDDVVLQGVKERTNPVRIKVSQWSFPDTGDFGGSILTCPVSEQCGKMETYARVVLTLFYPYRCERDLKSVTRCRFPFITKLREVYSRDERKKLHKLKPTVFTDTNLKFLQNLQDCAYNGLRYKVEADSLVKITNPYCPKDKDTAIDFQANEEDDEDYDDVCPYEELVDAWGNINEDIDPLDTDPGSLDGTLQNLSLKTLRGKGAKKCGKLSDVPAIIQTEEADVIQPITNNQGANNGNAAPFDPTPEERPVYNMKSLLEVFFRRSTARSRSGIMKDKDVMVSDATGTPESIFEWCKAVEFKGKQRRAFECVMAAFVLTFFEDPGDDTIAGDSSQSEQGAYKKMYKSLRTLRGTEDLNLMMLMHGAGGSGKTTVLEVAIEYARDFCRNLGHPFTSRTIVVLAMSGVAATAILGETAHSVLGMNRNEISDEERKEFKHTRLIFVDEISFASAKDFEKIDQRLRALLNEPFKPYGGMNIIFAGDYSQLEPVKADAIYKGPECPEFHGFVNAFVELAGMHRFKDDIEWGHMNMRFRSGKPTLEDIQLINNECLLTNKPAPAKIQTATMRNNDRDAINCATFEEYCKANKPEDGSRLTSAVIVLMDDLQMSNGNRKFIPITSNSVKKFFWEKCGESQCVQGSGPNKRGFVEPMLKLYDKCPLMFTHNNDVRRGQANGSRLIFQNIVPKIGESGFDLTLECGTIVRAFFAGQVDHILVRHENKKIIPAEFKVEAKMTSFRTELKLNEDDQRHVGMKGFQFPIVSNTCTTGHKLQGATVQAILVNSWVYTSNWVYVVLSRVRTMDGLYLREALSEDLTKYEMKPEMLAMIEKFEDTVGLKEFTEEEYNNML